MSNPTDTNQTSEDELKQLFATLFYDDYYDFAIDSILDWHNKQVEAVLDRLESKASYDPSGRSPLINPLEIQAERNKLTMANSPQLDKLKEKL